VVSVTGGLNVTTEPQNCYVALSTDANIPMSRGIPAIAIGGGGMGGDTHTPTEWYENRNGSRGIARAALLLAALAGTR